MRRWEKEREKEKIGERERKILERVASKQVATKWWCWKERSCMYMYVYVYVSVYVCLCVCVQTYPAVGGECGGEHHYHHQHHHHHHHHHPGNDCPQEEPRMRGHLRRQFSRRLTDWLTDDDVQHRCGRTDRWVEREMRRAIADEKRRKTSAGSAKLCERDNAKVKSAAD